MKTDLVFLKTQFSWKAASLQHKEKQKYEYYTLDINKKKFQ